MNWIGFHLGYWICLAVYAAGIGLHEIWSEWPIRHWDDIKLGVAAILTSIFLIVCIVVVIQCVSIGVITG